MNFPAGAPIGVVLLATAASGRRSVWSLPLIFAGVIALVSNLQTLAPLLPAGLVASLLGDKGPLGQLLGHPAFMVGGNLLAILIGGWAIAMLLRTSSPQLDLARRLEKNGDQLGAAETYLQAGDHRRALALFTKARAWSKASQVAMETGDEEEAAALLRRAGGRHLADAARMYRHLGDAKGARRCDLDLAEWLVQEGQFIEAIEALLRAGEKRRAMRAVKLALQEQRLKPGHPVFVNVVRAANDLGEHLLSAQLCELEGRWEEAANTWRLAGEHIRAAECFRRADRLDEAAVEEEKAGRTNEAVRLQLQLFKRLEDRKAVAESRGGTAGNEEVRRLQEQIRSMAEGLAPKLRELGMEAELVRLLQGVGRTEDAVKLLVNAGQIEQAADLAHDAQRWHLAGELLERLRRWGEASDDYELAGDLANAALCAERAGEDERAYQIYQRLGNVPRAAGCLARLGKLQEGLAELHRAGLPNEAVSLMRDHPGPIKDIPGVILDLARWLKDHSSIEEAIACLQRAVLGVALQPALLGPPVALAQLLLEAGDYELAMEHVDRVLQFDYSHSPAQQLKLLIRTAMSGPAATQAATQAAARPAGAQPLLSASVEQRYEIGEQLGQGGMGVVYRARDTRLERNVAVKVLRTTSADEAARLEREAKVAATLNHQGIAIVFDFEQGFGGYFIVMEYVPGDPLDKLLRKDRQRIANNLLPLLTDLINTVAYAHERNVVHRDLKPGNVILTPDNEVKILDFGIAARLNIEADKGTGVCGTPYYMSPEQIRGEAPTTASDIYSFGATAFHLATGQPPFKRGNVIDAHLTKEPPNPQEIAAELPTELCAIILRCLRKKPAERFVTASELHQALRQLS